MTRWSTENGSIVFLLEKLTNDVDQISFLNQLPQDGMMPIETEVCLGLLLVESIYYCLHIHNNFLTHYDTTW